VTPFTKLYVGAVIAAGAVLLAGSAPREYPQPALMATFVAAMTVVSLFKLRLPLGRGPATMSMAYVIDLMVIVTLGASVAMAIAAAGVLVQCLARARRRQPWYRTAFSVAAVALAVKTAAVIWAALGGSIAAPGVVTTLVPLAAAAAAYFAVNTGLVGAAVALSSGVSPAAFWCTSFVRTAPGYLVAAATVAAVQMLATREVYFILPAAAVPMILCHMLYASWFRQVAASQMRAPVYS
jgi:hypothetical protein